jgi:hypothetical protein
VSRYVLVESEHEPVIKVQLDGEVLAAIPLALIGPRAARAKARRFAERHAGHELDWRKDLSEAGSRTWFITWSAPAIETYFPQPELWEDLAS